MEFALLTDEVRDEEADIIISMLRAFGIEAHKEYEGAAGIAKISLGTAVFGVRVMVAADQLDEARGLLNAEPIFDDAEFGTYMEEDI